MQKIGELIGCSANTVCRVMKENGLKARTDREQALKYTCDEHYFDIVDTEEKAYWLGFMYADGFIQNKRKYGNYKVGLSLTESDKGHLEKLKKCLESNVEIKTYIPNTEYNSKPYCRILITSNILAEGLIKHGCLISKTEILTFPTNIPKELLKHFIRGYIDGDGCLTHWNSKTTGTFYSKIGIVGTKEVLEGIKHYFNLDHLVLGQRHPDREVNNYDLTIGGNQQVIKILDLLYGDSNIYLDRKYEKYLEIKRLYNEFINNCRA